jgi:hypothetical protein
MSSPRLEIETLAPGDVDIDQPFNNLVRRLDQVLNVRVLSATTAAQPGAPTSGDLYILPASPSGAQWAGKATGTLALYDSGTWYFTAPKGFIIARVADTEDVLAWSGAAWAKVETILGAKGADLAAAATVTLSSATGDYIHVTGTGGPITSFGTAKAGLERTLVHDAAHTLTHSANIINLGSTNILTAAGDVSRWRSEGGGVWRMTGYIRATGAGIFSPTSSQVRYVATTGSDSNSGLTALAPFATLQRAIDDFEASGGKGEWTINLAAGTYTEGAQFSGNHSTEHYVTIQGPSVGGTPNVPTAIIDGTSSVFRRGIKGADRLNVKIKDVKVVDFDGPDESGLEFMRFCRVYLDNAHATNCFQGWHFLDFTYYDALGGIIDACDTGVLELFGVVRNFKVATSDAERTLIQNCTEYGLKAKEMCTGHLDYAKIDNCNNGVFLSRCSTANLANCDIYNNTIGAVCTSGSSIVDSATTDWGATTSNANTIKFLMRGASSEVVRNGGENVPTSPYVGLTEKKVGFDYSVTAHTGTVTRTAIYSAIYSPKAGDFQAAGGHIRCRVYGVATALAGTCIVELRTAGANVCTVTLPAATAGGFVIDMNLYVLASGDSQQHFTEARINGGTSVIAAATRAVAFSAADTVLQVTAALSNSADNVTFRGAELYTTDA